VFREIASETKKIQPKFIAAKLTEDLTSLHRQGLDTSVLEDKDIKDVFRKLENGSIQKESIVLKFEEAIKKNSRRKCGVCKKGKMLPEDEGVAGMKTYKCDNCGSRELIAIINEQVNVNEAIEAVGASSITDEELSKGLDRIISNNMTIIKVKGANALNTLMGRAMAEYRGKANGQKVNAMLKDKMSKMVNK
jgi:glutamyl-tRNA(Gln) amidotransferase subunit E